MPPICRHSYMKQSSNYSTSDYGPLVVHDIHAGCRTSFDHPHYEHITYAYD